MARTMKQIVAEYNSLVNDDESVIKFTAKAIGEKAIAALKVKGPDAIDTSITLKDMTSRSRNAPVQDPLYPVTRIEALKQGYILYWNGSQCMSGHEAPRYTKTGVCKKCYQMFRGEEISQSEMDKDKLTKKKKKKGGENGK